MVLTFLEDGMVQRGHGEPLEDRGLAEIGIQPGRALQQGLRHCPGTSELLSGSGGLRGPARERTAETQPPGPAPPTAPERVER